MTTANSIQALHPYIQLAKWLVGKERLQESSEKLTYSVSLSYDVITVQVFRSAQQKALYIQVLFEINQKKIYVKDLYHKASDALALLNLIKSNPNVHEAPFAEPTDSVSWVMPYIHNYLVIADRIAEKALHQCTGDDYRPSYYSKIEITETHILLSQINHLNSRSLAHKENYSLRNLMLTIPLNEHAAVSESVYNTDRIGLMDIAFSDHSSANNRSAGDRIKDQINEEIRLYHTEKNE